MPSLITPDSPSPYAQTVGMSTNNVLDVALAAVGVYSYCWGGTAPPCFDCSGFVYWCFNKIGVPLKRAMSDQLQQGSVVPLGAPGNRLINAVPGDVVYFGLNNANAAKNHEGIITSTLSVGSMVNAACTACGPVRIDPIGEGSASDEPISAIRRFTKGMPGTVGQSVPQDQTAAGADDPNNPCDLKIPLFDVCVWRRSWGRAMLGGALFAGAFALGVAGVYLIVKANQGKLNQIVKGIPGKLPTRELVGKGIANITENGDEPAITPGPAPEPGPATGPTDPGTGHHRVGPHVYYGDVPEITARGG